MRLGLPTIGLTGVQSAAGVDADALAWASAVTAAGGTYSPATLTAVSTFVASAKGSGYWSKLNRINLFCGDQLVAALVPLKAGGGNALDAAVAFVGGDYTEATGLTGNGTTKYLTTGLIPSVSLSAASTHLALYNRSGGTAGGVIGSRNSISQALALFAPLGGGTSGITDQYNTTAGGGRLSAVLGTPFGFVVGSRTALTAHGLYRNALVAAADANSGGSMPTVEIYVGALNSAGAAANFGTGAMGGYSIGAGLSAADIAAYNTHMEAFQDALGRGVQ
jgi:hypothetical protein